MTDAEFETFTDKIINVLTERRIVLRSSNYMFCKRPTADTTKGGLVLPDVAKEVEMRKTGYGRIVAVPNNNRSDDDYSDIKPGMYFLYNHAGHYKPPIEAVRIALGIPDFPENVLYIVPDNEILFTQELA